MSQEIIHQITNPDAVKLINETIQETKPVSEHKRKLNKYLVYRALEALNNASKEITRSFDRINKSLDEMVLVVGEVPILKKVDKKHNGKSKQHLEFNHDQYDIVDTSKHSVSIKIKPKQTD